MLLTPSLSSSPQWTEKGVAGNIINMASVASSMKGAEFRFAYGASKAAVMGLTKSIAVEYVKDKIRCNAICPGETVILCRYRFMLNRPFWSIANCDAA